MPARNLARNTNHTKHSAKTAGHAVAWSPQPDGGLTSSTTSVYCATSLRMRRACGLAQETTYSRNNVGHTQTPCSQVPTRIGPSKKKRETAAHLAKTCAHWYTLESQRSASRRPRPSSAPGNTRRSSSPWARLPMEPRRYALWPTKVLHPWLAEYREETSMGTWLHAQVALRLCLPRPCQISLSKTPAARRYPRKKPSS